MEDLIFLHSFSLACPKGTFGDDCSEECPTDKYGELCSNECHCRPTEQCDPYHGCISTCNGSLILNF